MTFPIWSPFALLLCACVVPDRAWNLLGGVDWVRVLALAYCVGFWVLVGLVAGGVL